MWVVDNSALDKDIDVVFLYLWVILGLILKIKAQVLVQTRQALYCQITNALAAFLFQNGGHSS